jgi:hypothetical protein
MSLLGRRELDRFSACLRMYVSGVPEGRELAWREAQLFDRLPLSSRLPGTFYRYQSETSVIEFRADGSGQFHADGKLPAEVDPSRVVVIPDGGPVPTLMEEMLSLLGQVTEPKESADWAADLAATLKNLASPARSLRLVQGFQAVLAKASGSAKSQLEFLRPAALKMVESDLLLGRVTAPDACGLLMLTALAEAVAAQDEELCAKIVEKAATRSSAELGELGAGTLDDCWLRGLTSQVTAALDIMRSRGEGILRDAQRADYTKVPAEQLLGIYYGQLLQAVPWFIGAEGGYHQLQTIPGLDAETLAAFAHKAETAEEKLVRLWNALLYAVRDSDLSQLHGRQGYLKHILPEQQDRAKQFVFETIQLNYFYPPIFEKILLGEQIPLES